MKKYNYFSFFCSILVLSTTIIYLIIRIFIGLDFTDEMQHYGQIQGLLSLGKLFVNDFFLGQTGLIFIYPFLKIIQLFEPKFEFINLIFYSRILLFLIIIFTAILLFYLTKSYRLFSRITGACLVSISITEFNPFAFSYNSLSFLFISLIFSVWLFYNDKYKIFILSILVLFLGWTYQTLGILFSLIIATDYLIFSQLKKSIKFITCLIIFSLIFLLFIFWIDFFSINSLKESLYFSQLFPIGLRDYNFYLITFSSLIIILSFCFLVIFSYEPRFICFLRKKKNWLFYVSSLFIVCAGFYMLLNKNRYFIPALFFFASICIMILQNHIDFKNKSILGKIALSAVLISLTYASTSSLGFISLHRGFFISIGFLYLVYSSSINPHRIYQRLYIDILGIIIFIGLIINIFGNPYRDAYFFETIYKTNKVYAYNNIFISKTKLDAIEEIRKNISIEKNKTLLVLGPHPWIYFALNAKPNTPFLFNHSMIENNKQAIKIQEFLISKINSNEPDYIIDALPESSFFFKKNIETFINKYSCKEFVVNDKINNLLKKEVHFKLPSIIKFCSK